MDDRHIKRRFGQKVRQVREKKGWSQGQLGTRADMARTTITNIELGNQNVNLETLYKLARALETEPADLLPGTEPLREPTAGRLKELYEKLLEQETLKRLLNRQQELGDARDGETT